MLHLQMLYFSPMELGTTTEADTPVLAKSHYIQDELLGKVRVASVWCVLCPPVYLCRSAHACLVRVVLSVGNPVVKFHPVRPRNSHPQ